MTNANMEDKPSRSCVTKVDGGHLHEWIDADGEHHKYVHPTNLTHPAPSGQAVADARSIAEIIDPHSFIDIPFTDDPVLLDMVEQSKKDAIRKAERILSAIGHPVQPVWRPTHRHKKRGSEYMMLGIGKMQAEHWYLPGAMEAGPSVDMQEVAIYRSEDGKLWVRSREEFEDGRFEAIPAAPQPKGE